MKHRLRARNCFMYQDYRPKNKIDKLRQFSRGLQVYNDNVCIYIYLYMNTYVCINLIDVTSSIKLFGEKGRCGRKVS